jgi:apolipoprotein D and lipocalin family protein
MGLRSMVLLCLFLAACEAAPSRPLPLAADVDLARFMGDWYVIAATPTLIDAEAHNAIESYRLASDGTIETTYTFRDGAPTGPLRRYHPTATVRNGTGNAVWGMQFVWPFEADYRIYRRALQWLAEAGYDTALLRRIPQGNP